jgi:hypothetical protein
MVDKVRYNSSHYPMTPLTAQVNVRDTRWSTLPVNLERGEWEDASKYIMYIMTTMM